MYCCSQCSFTAQFETALMMHRQLHHEASTLASAEEQPSALPRLSPPSSPFSARNKGRTLKFPARTSSATKLLSKLKARIYKSRTLFSHPEVPESRVDLNNLSLASDCTSKALKAESVTTLNPMIQIQALEEERETYACHLCSFDADRITTLDRHLLNHHKIGLESLLKLVMAKTKEGLSDERNSIMYGLREPYYHPQNELIEEGEFIIETVTPQIKILKHASTNTETNDFNLEKNCELISNEIESMLRGEKSCDSEDFMTKMQTLNECMCKFVNSSNALKKVLTKEMDPKSNAKERYNAGEPFFNLVLGSPKTPRNWDRAHSEKMERTRNKYGDRPNKTKPSESFYY